MECIINCRRGGYWHFIRKESYLITIHLGIIDFDKLGNNLFLWKCVCWQCGRVKLHCKVVCFWREKKISRLSSTRRGAYEKVKRKVQYFRPEQWSNFYQWSPHLSCWRHAMNCSFRLSLKGRCNGKERKTKKNFWKKTWTCLLGIVT